MTFLLAALKILKTETEIPEEVCDKKKKILEVEKKIDLNKEL